MAWLKRLQLPLVGLAIAALLAPTALAAVTITAHGAVDYHDVWSGGVCVPRLVATAYVEVELSSGDGFVQWNAWECSAGLVEFQGTCTGTATGPITCTRPGIEMTLGAAGQFTYTDTIGDIDYYMSGTLTRGVA